MQPNTAISKLMVWSKRQSAEDGRAAAQRPPRPSCKMLSPFAPHLAEELWSRLGAPAVRPRPSSRGRKPTPAFWCADTITLAVQVNGKRRDEIQVPADASQEAVQALALAAENVARHVGDKTPKKVIVVPGRLVNIVL